MNLDPLTSLETPWRFDIAGIILVVGLLFFFKIGSYPLHVPDEARYSEIPREMVVTNDYVTPTLNGVKYFEKPPLLYWLQAGAIKAFGVNEWALRVPTVLLALLGVLMTYVVGRSLYGRWVGLTSCGMLATCVMYFVLSHAISIDMAFSVLISGCLFSLLLAFRQPIHSWSRRGWFWSGYIFSALAVLTKGAVGFLLPGAVVFLWLLITRRWSTLRHVYLLTGICWFLVLVLPWHIAVQVQNPEFFQYYVLDQQILRYFTDISDHVEPFWFYVPLLLLGFFPWTIFLVQALVQPGKSVWRSNTDKPELLFLMLWAGIIFVFFSLSGSKLIPYILPIFPAIAIIVGRYVVVAWQGGSTFKSPFWVFTVLTFVLAIGAFILPSLVTRTEQAFMTYYVWSLGIIFLLAGAGVGYLVLKHKRTRWGFSIVLAMTVILQLQFVTVWPRLDDRSIKPLALQLQTLLQVGDELVAYRSYYQDLPLYMQQIITLVDPTGEITEGLAWTDTRDWIIDEEEFRTRWESDTRMFVMTPQRSLPALMADDPERVHIIDETRRHVLVSNQEGAS